MTDIYKEPTLKDLLLDLREAWFYVLAGAIAGLLAAFAFFQVSIPQYRAEMLIGPTSETATADITALLGQFDLPNLQYIVRRPGPSESADFVRFENIFTGPSVAAFLLEDKGLLKGISEDRDFKFSDPVEADNAVRLSEYLTKKVKIHPVGATYLRRVRYSHPDPQFAAALLSKMWKTADEMIRREVNTQTEKRISYVKDQLDKVSHPQHREALVSILMEQEQIRMMVNMGEPFAAVVAEPPASTSKPYWPKRSLFFPAFILIGAFAGYMISSLRRA
jgi:hypothetical protein